ncbi:L-ornithine 5-monooxygenase (L-ornithine N(5)-oxygenase) [Massariosphaeria phaeospora]|uniref:L-ornithine N(5)-monooxygenase [NAD(P)H] n=1 Tax=Massariosphaeria phaeospora TaxID=100035 RepID=A0A7C8I1Z6_9PLEO|nr:L-ornithine 5-monooxygenase (L-ornithine N(5)-oxygenase) [Massariosphaeria phaeospora]
MSPHADSPDGAADNHSPAIQQACPVFATDCLEDSHFPELENRSHLRYTPDDELYDLVCVGFGPASLGIAVALHDTLESRGPPIDVPGLNRSPKVVFLEKQHQFHWHAGMLLPGAKMQITFMKDMASMRNPRSEFTFINYLFKNDRLAEFANLNTFLPQRVEYECYLKWCASWFEEVVSYNQEVVKVVPEKSSTSNGKFTTFVVTSRNLQTGKLESRRTKHVVVAAGGRPNVPPPFPSKHSKVAHSSRFSHVYNKLLPHTQHPYNVAIIGNGQSAAEIFNFLHIHYPNSRTRLLIKGGALRPSDDSPFVNEIFNPARVDSTFNRASELRASSIREDKGTNYGVVRLNLLEHIYETLYMQRVRYGNSPEAEVHWPHRIMPYRCVTEVENSPVVKDGVRLHIRDQSPLYLSEVPDATETREILDFDAVFVATGYHRDLHETLLQDARHLMPRGALNDAKWEVQRDYRLHFADNTVGDDAGVWLQGCCESSHGVSGFPLAQFPAYGTSLTRSGI